MPQDLRGQVIVITGASSGIGAATAIACARAGMDVVLNARRADRLEGVAAEVERAGRRAAIVPGDVTEEGISERMLDAAESDLGRLDVVFANAGFGMDRAVVDMTGEDLRHIFEVNFFAATDLVNAAARRLLRQKRPGHLLMCSSCVAKFTLPNHSAYSATKAAQSHLCRAMRIELEPHGIHVSGVYPITTETEFHQVSQRRSGRETRDAVPGHAPRLFVQSPERVARAVVACLRRPRPEVWTSFTTRAAAAAMTLFPGFLDMVMRRAAKADGK
jgi:short-subunit dehydrogenase